MAAQTCLPFCSLLMMITVLKSVRPPTDGKILARLQPLSMISLQESKSHSSKAPKSESFPHATPSDHGSATPVHTKIDSPITLELQTTSTQHEQSSPQVDKLGILFEGLHLRIAEFENVLYSTNNQIQMHLTTIET